MSNEFDNDDTYCDSDNDCEIDTELNEDDDGSTISIDLTDMLDELNQELVLSGGDPIVMDELIDMIVDVCDEKEVSIVLEDEDGDIVPLNSYAEEDLLEEQEQLQQQSPIRELATMSVCDCSTCYNTCATPIVAIQPVEKVSLVFIDEVDTEEDINLQGIPYSNIFEAQDAESSTTLDMGDEDES